MNENTTRTNENILGELLQKCDMLAYDFFKLNRFDLAYIQCEIAINLDPLNKNLRFNSAKCAYYSNNYEKAIEHINIASMLDSNCENCKRELALYLPWVGKVKESLKILKSLPQDPRTRFNLGWHNLMDNRFKEGMKCLEAGRLISCWGNSTLSFPIPKWNGEHPLNKKLLIAMEGGLGDEIIFSRFATDLNKQHAKVYIQCSDAMKNILSRIEGVEEVYGFSDNIDYNNFDFWIPSMGLPFLMKLENVKGTPYLKTDQKYVDKWKEKIKSNKIKIGIRWQGGKAFEHDQRRTIPVNELVNSLKQYGDLFSLQKDSDEQCPKDIVNLENQLDTWDDTLAAISLMDVVVTSCTSITHAAAALGIPTIVITPIVPYFTWSKLGNKADWYDCITIYRQTDPYSWSAPINEASKYLEQIIKL